MTNVGIDQLNFCRSRLSVLNEKLTLLERKVDHLEARVATGGDQNNQ